MDGIIAEGVSKIYQDGKGNAFTALDHVSFTWRRGENISIIGESGSGKSTLGRMLIGLEKTSHGNIRIEGESISKWSYDRWRKQRKIIQAVFQDSSGTLNPRLSVYQNIEEALCNLTDLDKRKRKSRIYEMLELAEMNPQLLQVSTHQLSGGEQRRISLLRALSIHPVYLVLDEVMSGLDLLSADAVLSVLELYHREFDCSYLLITHDRQNAYRISDRIFEMRNGKIVKEGTRKANRQERN